MGAFLRTLQGLRPTDTALALYAPVSQAQAAAYAAVDAIDFPSGFCRRDIGWREVAREAR